MAILTISRQYGAGGLTLGQKVARRLNYEFVDRALLAKVAKEAGVSLQTVEAAESEAGDRLLRLVSSLVSSDFMQRHVGEEKLDFDEKKFVKFVTKAINEIADQGNAVIVGRGGQFVLRDRPDAVRLLLVAERSERIAFIQRKLKISQEDAEAVVSREEDRRARFLGNFSNGKPDDPCNYHLVINTGLVSLQVAEEQICHLVQSYG